MSDHPAIVSYVTNNPDGSRTVHSVVPDEPSQDGDVFKNCGSKPGLWRGGQRLGYSVVKTTEPGPDLSPEAVEALAVRALELRDADAANRNRNALHHGAVQRTLRALRAALTAAEARADSERDRAERMEGEVARLREALEEIDMRGLQYDGEDMADLARAALASQADDGEGRKPRPATAPIYPEDDGA